MQMTVQNSANYCITGIFITHCQKVDTVLKYLNTFLTGWPFN